MLDIEIYVFNSLCTAPMDSYIDQPCCSKDYFGLKPTSLFCYRRVGGTRTRGVDSVWSILTGQATDNVSSFLLHDIREIETWILRSGVFLGFTIATTCGYNIASSMLAHYAFSFWLQSGHRDELISYRIKLPLGSDWQLEANDYILDSGLLESTWAKWTNTLLRFLRYSFVEQSF